MAGQPGLPPPSSPSPQVAVLSNSPALHALKRPQLVSLCKQFGLKAGGKNVDLIDKLKAYGTSLNSRAAAPAPLAADEDEPVEAPDAGPADGDISTTWSLISPSAAPSASDLRTLAEFGTQDSPSKTISQSSSSHSLSSTLRTASTSIRSGLNTLASKFHPDLPGPSLALPTPVDSPHPLGIRLVDSETPAAHPVPAKTTLVARLAPGTPPSTAPAFIFGSPSAASAPGFTFGLSGAEEGAFGSTSGFVFGGEGAEGKTAAERVREELERRTRESRGAGWARNVELTVSARASVVEKEGKKGAFDGKHKREFDKMESIANHYAAKRPLAQSSSSTLAIAPDRATKRLKLPSAPVARSPEKKLVDALRDSGWMAESNPAATGVNFAASVRSKASGTLGKSGMREGLVPNDGREDVERKRKLEMAKARRKSAVGGAQGGRRRSLVVGPQKTTGNMASRFLKTTLKKLTSASTTAPPAKPISPVIKRPAFGSSTVTRPTLSSSRPALASSTTSSRLGASTAPKHTFGSGPSRAAVVVPGSVKKQPSWKKFDLQKSLARPLNYVPKLGSKAQLSANNVITSAPTASFRLSTASTSSRAPLKRTSSLSKATPAPALSRRPSARVANPSLLGAVKPGQSSVEREVEVETKELVEEDRAEEMLEEDMMEEVVEELEEEMMAIEEELAAVEEDATDVSGSQQDALTAPSTSLAHSIFPSAASSQNLVSLPSSPAKSPFRPTKPDLPARHPLVGIASPIAKRTSRSSVAMGGKKGASPARKMVSSSSRAARDGGKGRNRSEVVGLETKAKMVKARKGKGRVVD